MKASPVLDLTGTQTETESRRECIVNGNIMCMGKGDMELKKEVCNVCKWELEANSKQGQICYVSMGLHLFGFKTWQSGSQSQELSFCIFT